MDSKLAKFFLLGWAVAFGFSIPYILGLVADMGYQIPGSDIGSDYLKGVAFALFFTVVIFLFPVRAVDRKNLLILWGAKCAVTLGAMLVYEWKYGLDAYWYFERSQLPYPDFTHLGFGNGTENLVACLWGFEHYVFHTASYHSMKVISSFAGFLGIYAFYRGLAKYDRELNPRALLYIGLFPSILFWSSILGKDPFALLGIGLCFYSVLRLFSTRNPLYFAPLAVALLYLSFIRSWMAPILMLPFLVSAVLNFRSRFLRAAGVVALVGLGLYGIRYLGQSMAMESAEAVVGQVNQISKSWQSGGSAGDVPNLDSPAKILLFLPYGMFTALFRPLPGDVMNPFGLLAGLENLFLIYLLFQAFRRRGSGRWGDPMTNWMLIYVLLWASIYAFISPQNLGSSVRFKLQVLPALLVMLAYFSGFKRLRRAGVRERTTDSTEESAHASTY